MVNNILKADDIIIQTHDLWKVYKSGKEKINVLTGIDLSIKKGEFVSISGASGVGKSTLLHILGLLDEPTRGKVYYRGVESTSLSNKNKAELRNKAFGFIFQFFHLLPEFNAVENVLLPALIRKNSLSHNQKLDRAKSLLEQVGLSHRLKHKPSQLSGGEQQRVAIARAFMNEPDIIFADEPTGNLDKVSSSEIQEIIMNLNEKMKQAFVLVTHNLDLAKIGHVRLNLVDGALVNAD